MDPLIIVLVVLVVVLGVSIRVAGADKRRRQKAYEAYFQRARRDKRKR
jgi:hypothetical protein